MKARRKSLWGWVWVVLVALYFFIPLIATADFSLRARKGVLSLLAYQQVFQDPNFLKTFTFSLEMAVLTILASILLVVPAAYWIHLRMPNLRPLIEFITLMPFVVPAIVLVFGLIRVYSGPPFYLTNTRTGTDLLLVAGYVVLALPYMYRAVDTGLRSMDVHALTEAAQSLGADGFTVLFGVILPNLRTALLSGAFLTLAIVMGEFTIASFLVGLDAFGPYMWQIGQNKAYESSALAIISFLLTWVAMGVIQLLSRGTSGAPQIGGGR